VAKEQRLPPLRWRLSFVVSVRRPHLPATISAAFVPRFAPEALDCGSDQRDGLLPVGCRTTTIAEPHAAEADRRDLEAGFAEGPLLHGDFSFIDCVMGDAAVCASRISAWV
jgi:hypothetical protein